jgi:hypothetical protein
MHSATHVGVEWQVLIVQGQIHLVQVLHEDVVRERGPGCHCLCAHLYVYAIYGYCHSHQLQITFCLKGTPYASLLKV